MAENKATIVIDANAAQAIAEMDRAKKAAERMQKGVSGGGGAGLGGGMASGINRATRSMQRFGNEAKKGTRGAADGMMQLAYFADDAQYGMRGILNNIPGMVMGFGASAAAAGGISIAVLGIAKLIDGSAKRWGESLADALNPDAQYLKDLQRQFIEDTNKRQAAIEKRVETLKEEVATSMRLLEINKQMTQDYYGQVDAMRQRAAENRGLVNESLRMRIADEQRRTDPENFRKRAMLTMAGAFVESRELDAQQRDRAAKAEENARLAQGEVDNLRAQEYKLKQTIADLRKAQGDKDTREIRDQKEQLKLIREQIPAAQQRVKNAEELRDSLQETAGLERYIFNQRAAESMRQLNDDRIKKLMEERGDASSSLQSISEAIRMPLTSLQQIGGERAASPYGLGGDIARQQLNKLTEINQSIQRLRAGYN